MPLWCAFEEVYNDTKDGIVSLDSADSAEVLQKSKLYITSCVGTNVLIIGGFQLFVEPAVFFLAGRTSSLY